MSKKQIVDLAMKHYEVLRAEGIGAWQNKRFRDAQAANGWFIFLLLDRIQPAWRAWDGGNHFVKNHFTHGDFWTEISKCHLGTLKRICNSGFEGNAYALSVTNPTFPSNLKKSAELIVSEYSGDVRNVWNDIRAPHVRKLYDRLIQFPGIGVALARMGQFDLVRQYGVGGGEASKSKLCIKPDVHVCRVAFRAGLTSSARISVVMREIDAMRLASPADFDLAMWNIGQNYCKPSKPVCQKCPLNPKCPKILE